jgi:hypothetical protein
LPKLPPLTFQQRRRSGRSGDACTNSAPVCTIPPSAPVLLSVPPLASKLPTPESPIVLSSPPPSPSPPESPPAKAFALSLATPHASAAALSTPAAKTATTPSTLSMTPS